MDKKEAPREPVEYEVQEKSLIGNEIHEAGAIVKYDGLPAENLKPLCDVGRARYQEYLESNKVRVAKMIEQNSTSAVGDPAEFAKALQKYQAEQVEAMSKAISEGIAAGVALAMEAIAKAQQTSAAAVEIKAADASTATPADSPNTAANATATKGKSGGKDSLV